MNAVIFPSLDMGELKERLKFAIFLVSVIVSIEFVDADVLTTCKAVRTGPENVNLERYLKIAR